jgi:hypothetical protein
VSCHQVSNTRPIPHTTSLTTLVSRSPGRGSLPPLAIFLHRRFTPHARNRATDAWFSSFWPKSRLLASRWRTCSPPAASISSTRTHQLPASPHIAVSHGVSETELRTLGFRFFGPNPAAWPHVGECAALPPPLSHQPAPTTSKHCPTSPFHTERPKLSNKHSVSCFWPKTETPQHVTKQTATPAPAPHLPTLAATQRLPRHPFEQRTPKPSHNHSVSGFWPQTKTHQCATKRTVAHTPAPHLHCPRNPQHLPHHHFKRRALKPSHTSSVISPLTR